MSARSRKTNIGGLGAVYRGIYLQMACALIAALAVCARVTGGARTFFIVLVMLLSAAAAGLILLGLLVSSNATVHFRRGRNSYLVFLGLLLIGILAYLFWFRSFLSAGRPFTPQLAIVLIIYGLALIISELIGMMGVLNGCGAIARLHGGLPIKIRCILLWLLHLVTIAVGIVLIVMFVRRGATVITQVIEENAGTVTSLDAFYGRLKPFVIMFILFVIDFLASIFLRFRMAGMVHRCLRAYHGKSRPVEVANTADTQSLSDAPGIADAATTADTTDTQSTPSISDAQSTTDTSDTSNTADVQNTTGTSDTADVQSTPDASDASDTSDTPAAESTPVEPDTAATPITPSDAPEEA